MRKVVGVILSLVGFAAMVFGIVMIYWYENFTLLDVIDSLVSELPINLYVLTVGIFMLLIGIVMFSIGLRMVIFVD